MLASVAAVCSLQCGAASSSVIGGYSRQRASPSPSPGVMQIGWSTAEGVMSPCCRIERDRQHFTLAFGQTLGAVRWRHARREGGQALSKLPHRIDLIELADLQIPRDAREQNESNTSLDTYRANERYDLACEALELLATDLARHIGFHAEPFPDFWFQEPIASPEAAPAKTPAPRRRPPQPG